MDAASTIQLTSSMGRAVTFDGAKSVVSVAVQGGEIWVQPLYAPPGSNPSDPTSVSAGTIIKGWCRMLDGDAATWGASRPTLTSITARQDILLLGLNVWCVSAGYLTIAVEP